MKQILIIAISVSCLMLSGCIKDYYCDREAPQDKEINWNDYNTVSAVADYFCDYLGTVKAHYRDTVMVKGYVVMDNRQDGYVGMVDDQTITIADKPGLYGYNADDYSKLFWITCNKGFDFMADYFSNQMVYFKGVLDYEQFNGCQFNVSIII